jgi:hypothetical protein
MPLVLLTCLGPPAAANDFEAAGVASGLAPVEASRIRLVTERVVLTQTADDWRADATYVFHNPTGEPITTTFAFPEGCPDLDGDDSATGLYTNPQFRDLVTRVRGQPVATRIAEVRPWQGLALCIGRVHAFDIALAPNERVEVSHRYRFSTAAGIGFEEVQYITRTGALWNGPIASAEFILSPRTAAFGLSWPAGFRFAGFEERAGAAGEEGRIAYRFEARDWTPGQDFVVSLHGWPIPSTLAREKGIALPCPDAATIMGGDAPSEPVAEGPLSGLSDADLGLCRNLPYARHGYPFQRTDLREALYREVPVPGEDGADPRRFRLAAPNGFYSDALLDDTDRAYIAALQSEHERRTGAAGVLDALQAELRRTLGVESVLQVEHVKVKGDWAWVHVLPRSPDGRQHYEDVSALLRKADGRWRVEEIACAEEDDPDCLGSRSFASGLKDRFPGLPLEILDPAAAPTPANPAPAR